MNCAILSQIMKKITNDRVMIARILFIQSMVALTACEHIGPDPATKIPLEPLSVISEEKEEAGIPDQDIYGNDQNEDQSVKPIAPEIWEGKGTTVHFHPEKHKKPPANGKYTLNFDDADLGEVAKVILGDTLNENYVLSPRVGGRVTLQTSRPLTRDELLPALEMLLRMNNAVLIKGDGIYKIEPAANALRGIGAPGLGRAGQNLPPGYQVRIVPLKYVGVVEVQEILKPIMDPKALIRADVARNLLMLAGTSEELENLLSTIHIFDVDWMEGMSAGLFTLQHTEVETILDEVEQILGVGKDGPLAGIFRLIPLERLNAILVITPQPGYLQKAKMWIARLDKLAPDGLGGEGVYVYKVANVVATELAETLNDIFSGRKKNKTSKASLAPGRKPGKVSSKNKRSPGSRRVSAANLTDVRIVPDEVNNALIITATPSEYEAIKGVIRQLDVVPLQVLIDAMIVEVTLDDTLKYGVEWSGRWGTNFNIDTGTVSTNGSSTQGNSNSTNVPTSGSTTNGSTTGGSTNGGSTNGNNTSNNVGLVNQEGVRTGSFDSAAGIAKALYTYGIFKGFQIEAKLNALATNNSLHVVSTPSMLVLNNQEAFINVGDEVPIPTSQATNTNSTNNTGVVITNQIQYLKTGVQLKVTPRVNPGGLVIMEIEQQSDAAIPTTTSSLNAPTIRKREITSTLAVQNGDTIVLGGLIQERRDGGVSGIPILKDLPLIGPLFGTTTKNLNRTELIVLLTPRVIENRMDARESTRELQRKLSGVFVEVEPESDVVLEHSDLVDDVSED